MYNKSFVEACLNADATLFDLDDYIEYWHTHETGNTLQEFLGLTDYEYEQWGKSSDIIFRDIIRCRQEWIAFSEYQLLSESERIAARSYDQEAIEKMNNASSPVKTSSNAKPGSLMAKANMVKDYNERNNK